MNADDRSAPVHSLEIPSGDRLAMAVDRVRRGLPVADFLFDAIYPGTLRLLSRRYWTPIEVARSAAELLVMGDETSVLDIGCGAGKFCMAASFSTAGQFTGIEQRGHLVEVAEAIAQRYDVPRAKYVHGDIRDVDWSRFDAFYCFNSFAENIFEADEQFDDSVELSAKRREEDLDFVVEALAKTRLGSRLVTYHGLGCDLPPCFECVDSVPAGSALLELWVKTRG